MKTCLRCEKTIFVKGLCRPHYRQEFEYPGRRTKYKEYRKTTTGKEVVKRWNKSPLGKEALNRYQKKPSSRYSFGKSRAKTKGCSWTIEKEKYIELISNPCYYCEGKLAELGVGLDRVDSSKGYDLNNVVPCCTQCNLGKMDYNQQEFYIWIEKIYNKHIRGKM